MTTIATDPLVRSEVDHGIATITLNNPKKRNALSTAMMTALKQAFDSLEHDDAVRVVILKAEGPVFSAGHDLNELRGRCDSDYAGVFALCTELMETIRELPQPVIAQVDGLATAAGCQLVASCNLAVCSEESKFGTPGVKTGLFCTTPGVALARAVSRKKAMEMLLTGTPIDARDAERAGLVSRVVPKAELDATARDLAAKIAEASSETVAIGKRAFYRQVDMGVPEAYEYASGVMVENLAKPDANEGISAFLEKRPPRWNT